MTQIRTRHGLPEPAFCGPNRTMPCHDADHTRRAITNLALSINRGTTFMPHIYLTMIRCITRRAKKFGVTISHELALILIKPLPLRESLVIKQLLELVEQQQFIFR